ncbi:MAG: metal ABC transporter ATP-binding protein [Kofleriaceae bacterium]
MSEAIELANVTIRRDGRAVVEDVTLAISAGTIHVVIGPNGAGKSTLLAALLGQIAFTGTIAQHFKRDAVIGYVPQSFVADRTLPITVGEFLALSRQKWPVCLGVRSHARAKIGELLAKVGLPGFERRRLGELSGGELRRVLIANALDPVPELLLCDEPATGLDPAAVLQLDGLLTELRDQHRTTIVLVSHDREQVRRIANRVTLLDVTVRDTGQTEKVLERAGKAVT